MIEHDVEVQEREKSKREKSKKRFLSMTISNFYRRRTEKKF